jgi:hypothetical protein
MGFLRTVLFSVCILTPALSLGQQGHPGPKFGALQCRADAQKWTTDPSDDKDPRNLGVNTVIMVNGQFRSMSHATPHVTVTGLMDRIHEMDVCRDEDEAFEKQFSTYSTISKSYSEEVTFRYDYFLTRHDLRHQFFQEDAEMNK